MEGLPDVQISLSEFQDKLCRALMQIQARFLEQDTRIEALSKRCTDLECRLARSAYMNSFSR